MQKTWPTGYHVGWGGQFEQMQQAQRRLAIVVPLAGLLIFVLLYASFHSVRDALLIYSGVPFAIVGGVIGLGGARNAVFDFGRRRLRGPAGHCRAQRPGAGLLHQETAAPTGTNLNAAIADASVLRLRPVLMTSATAALGFVPMMMATAIGAEVQRPLATVVVGGVISSLLLTLLVLPVLYSLFGQSPVEPGATAAASYPPSEHS